MLRIGTLDREGGRMRAVVKIDVGLVGFWVDNPREGYDADGLKDSVLVSFEPADQFCRIISLEEVGVVLGAQGAI